MIIITNDNDCMNNSLFDDDDGDDTWYEALILQK